MLTEQELSYSWCFDGFCIHYGRRELKVTTDIKRRTIAVFVLQTLMLLNCSYRKKTFFLILQ